jgi:hypothetical protein
MEDILQYIETCSGLKQVDVSGKEAVLRSVVLRAREAEKRLLVLFKPPLVLFRST